MVGAQPTATMKALSAKFTDGDHKELHAVSSTSVRSQQEKILAPIEKLPVEIFIKIFEFIQVDHDKRQNTFLALCRTSRQLNGPATPFLYTDVPVGYSWNHLLRTLDAVPDLKKYIKSLDLTPELYPLCGGRPKELAMFADVALPLNFTMRSFRTSGIPSSRAI